MSGEAEELEEPWHAELQPRGPTLSLLASFMPGSVPISSGSCSTHMVLKKTLGIPVTFQRLLWVVSVSDVLRTLPVVLQLLCWTVRPFPAVIWLQSYTQTFSVAFPVPFQLAHHVCTAHGLLLALVALPHRCLVGIAPSPPVLLLRSCRAHGAQGLALALAVTASSALPRVGGRQLLPKALPAAFRRLPGCPEVRRLPWLRSLPLCPPPGAGRRGVRSDPPPGTGGPLRGRCAAQRTAAGALPQARQVHRVPSTLPLRGLPCTPSLPGGSAPLQVRGVARLPSAPPAFLGAPRRAKRLRRPPLRPAARAGGAWALSASLLPPAGAGRAQGGVSSVPDDLLRVPSWAGGTQGHLRVSAALLKVPGGSLTLREQGR